MAYRQGYRPPSSSQSRTVTTQYSSSRKTTGRQPAQKARKTRSRRSRRPLWIFLILVIVAVAATFGVMAYIIYDEVGSVEEMNTFYPYVYVDGVALYGATPQEAYEFLLARAQSELAGWSINLQYGEQTWTIDPDLLGMNEALDTAVREAVNQAFFVGRGGDSIMARYSVINALKDEPYYGYTATVDKNMSQIDGIISEIQAAVYRAPQDATRSFDPSRKGNAIAIEPEVNGQELDAQALKERLVAMINSMEGGTINIEPTPVLPTYTADGLASDIVLLGSYASPINKYSTEERTLNVERGCEAFNGLTVKPGERVSFNSVVGKRTKKNGFYEAQEIVSGAYEMGVGGGICQVSSTLYNAVITANLRVRERTNHGIPVNYMDMGADATVSDDRHDFIFENNTEANIYITARVESSSRGKTCVFHIYGRPDPNGYSYSLKHETLETIPIPDPTRIPDKQEQYVLYLDEEHQVSKGAEGYKVRTYLVTRDANGAIVDEKELYVDTYKAQAPRIYVGVNRRPN